MKKKIRSVCCILLVLLMLGTVCGCAKPVITVQSVTMPASATLGVGESATLSATVTFSDGSTNSQVNFSTSDDSVVAIAGEKVTALKAGVATVTATSKADESKKAECVITVTQSAGVTLSKSSMSLLVGGEETLTAMVKLTDGSDSSAVSWASSNTAVATVDGGKVTGIKNGAATITATSTVDNTLKASCSVTVSYEAKIEMNQSVARLKVGAPALKLSATVRLANGSANFNVTWSSSDASVATVVGGDVSGLKAGEAIITATSVDMPTLSATCVVTVYGEAGITLNKSVALLGVGRNVNLIADVVLADGTINHNATWASSNTAVATVVGGVVTGVTTGTATITATSVDMPTLSATCSVKVGDTGIVISKTEVSLFQGGQETLTAEAILADGQTPSIGWTSGNSSIATVNGNGTITAIAPGVITITALVFDTNVSATCQVTVHTPQSVTITRADALMLMGSPLHLDAEALYAGNISSSEVIWESSNSAVATVNNGTVTPISAGGAVITAKVPNGNTFISGSCTIEVRANATGIDTITENGVTLTLQNKDDNDILHYSAKAQNTSITTATIPAIKNRVAVTEIEANGFKGCSALTSINMGANVVYIGSYAFDNATRLTGDFTLNPNTKMAEYAFTRAKFQKITISEGTTVIPMGAFQTCAVREVVFPRSLKEIKSYAFADCKQLLTAILTNTSLEMIGTEMVGTKLGNSFYDCNSLRNVGALPNTLKEIGFATFLKCNSLTQISLGNDIRKIGGQAFFHCANIGSLTIPASVRIVGEGAFNGWGSNQTLNVAFSASSKPIGFHSNWLGDNSHPRVAYNG